MEHWPLALRIAFGLIVAAHGVAHLVGVQSLWGMRPPEGSEPLPEPALTWLATGAAGKAMGALWLLACLAFVAVGILLIIGRPTLIPLVAVSAASLVLCLTMWPAAPIGIGFNAALLALAAALWFGGVR